MRPPDGSPSARLGLPATSKKLKGLLKDAQRPPRVDSDRSCAVYCRDSPRAQPEHLARKSRRRDFISHVDGSETSTRSPLVKPAVEVDPDELLRVNRSFMSNPEIRSGVRFDPFAASASLLWRVGACRGRSSLAARRSPISAMSAARIGAGGSLYRDGERIGPVSLFSARPLCDRSLRIRLDRTVRAERGGVAPTPGELRLAPAGDRGRARRTPAAKARHLWRPAVRGGAPAHLADGQIYYGETSVFVGDTFIISVRHGSERAHSGLRQQLESFSPGGSSTVSTTCFTPFSTSLSTATCRSSRRSRRRCSRSSSARPRRWKAK